MQMGWLGCLCVGVVLQRLSVATEDNVLVQVDADLLKDVVGDVVGWVVGDDHVAGDGLRGRCQAQAARGRSQGCVYTVVGKYGVFCASVPGDARPGVAACGAGTEGRTRPAMRGNEGRGGRDVRATITQYVRCAYLAACGISMARG